jgi:hypothetical protein
MAEISREVGLRLLPRMCPCRSCTVLYRKPYTADPSSTQGFVPRAVLPLTQHAGPSRYLLERAGASAPRVAFALSEPASPRVLGVEDEMPPAQSVIPPHTPRLNRRQSKATTPQIRASERRRRFAGFKQFFQREVADVVGARY